MIFHSKVTNEKLPIRNYQWEIIIRNYQWKRFNRYLDSTQSELLLNSISTSNKSALFTCIRQLKNTCKLNLTCVKHVWSGWTLECNLHIYKAPVSIVTVMHSDRESESYVWPMCPKSLFIAQKIVCFFYSNHYQECPWKSPYHAHTHSHTPCSKCAIWSLLWETTKNETIQIITKGNRE